MEQATEVIRNYLAHKSLIIDFFNAADDIEELLTFLFYNKDDKQLYAKLYNDKQLNLVDRLKKISQKGVVRFVLPEELREVVANRFKNDKSIFFYYYNTARGASVPTNVVETFRVIRKNGVNRRYESIISNMMSAHVITIHDSTDSFSKDLFESRKMLLRCAVVAREIDPDLRDPWYNNELKKLMQQRGVMLDAR